MSSSSRVGRCLTELAPLVYQMETLAPRVIAGEEEAVRQVKELISSVTEEKIEHLPSIRACQKCDAPILVADILLSRRSVAISAFGFRRAGDRMALHDHPRIRGFLKCVRGAMKVRSFTTLSTLPENKIECRYEGETTANTTSEVLLLAPGKGNIHEIVALEDGTFFFDALYPPYRKDSDCRYYYEEGEPATELGSTATLRRLPDAPEWQEMIGWRFPKL